MRAPLSWIRDFTPLDAPVPDVVSALNQLGLEVEAVERPGEEINGVVVARVLNVERHPNAVHQNQEATHVAAKDQKPNT